MANSERITYQNLYYFLKDFRTAVDNTDISVDGIAYEIDEAPSFAVFKGGLAVAGRERLQLLTASGGVNLSAPLDMAKPQCAVSTDLLLVYGMGETSYHIYNAFTKIHADTVDGAIRAACLSESGVYSIVAEDDEYASAVYVYTRNFKKCNKYNLNSDVIAAPVSADGKSIAILSYDVTDGKYHTRLRLAEIGSDRIYCDYVIDDEFPLGV
ncbi:MAG: hypothetical protein J6B77_04330, partial [Clostridia bacterium]|nr:hypothetical protein [Clostridia bacterium]